MIFVLQIRTSIDWISLSSLGKTTYVSPELRKTQKEIILPNQGDEEETEKKKQEEMETPCNSSEDTAVTQKVKDEEEEVEQFPWWAGGGIKPKMVHELGVFDCSLER